LNLINIDDFIDLCYIDKDTISEDFLAEIDIMLDEAVNPNVRNDFELFLLARDKLVKESLLYSLEKEGEELFNNNDTFYSKPKMPFSDFTIYVDKKSGEVVRLFGDYTPEFFKPVGIDFSKLSDEQKMGFIKYLPKQFIDEKMLKYFYYGDGEIDVKNIVVCGKSNLNQYKEINNKDDIDLVLEAFSKYNPVLHGFALESLYGPEMDK